jgi:hypothetical protein
VAKAKKLDNTKWESAIVNVEDLAEFACVLLATTHYIFHQSQCRMRCEATDGYQIPMMIPMQISRMLKAISFAFVLSI